LAQLGGGGLPDETGLGAAGSRKCAKTRTIEMMDLKAPYLRRPARDRYHPTLKPKNFPSGSKRGHYSAPRVAELGMEQGECERERIIAE
jgi:hypothetical protein